VVCHAPESTAGTRCGQGKIGSRFLMTIACIIASSPGPEPWSIKRKLRVRSKKMPGPRE
jgi:hypothetical protein